MSVTGLLDGQRVTEEYTAKNLDELKADNPPAAELYERWGLAGPNTCCAACGSLGRRGCAVQSDQPATGRP